MKRLLSLFAILVVLAGLAYLVKSNSTDKKTSLTANDRNFGYPREDIGKITIQKVDYPMQTFTKNNEGDWTIDDKYKVSEFAIPYLLQTVSDLQIQNIPAKSATENILKDINRIGLQVKIYNRSGEEVRSYKVGLESSDDRGTIFLMDGSKQPYNMFLKGFDGNLRTRFYQPIDSWRDKEIFKFDPTQIKEVAVKYHKDQKSSFRLMVDGTNISIEPLSQFIKPSSKEIDLAIAKAYLGSFTRVYGEDYDNSNVRRDSISRLVPFATVAVSDRLGKISEVDFYPFRDLLLKNVNTKDLKDAEQIERYFIKHSKGDFMVAQQRLVKDVFRPYEFFLKD